jgi:hypothetical protein
LRRIAHRIILALAALPDNVQRHIQFAGSNKACEQEADKRTVKNNYIPIILNITETKPCLNY